MTWYAVYRASNGQLVSVGEVVADPLPDGLASVAIDGPDIGTHEWDAAALSFVPRLARASRVSWSRYDFLKRIPTPKRIGIRVAAKNNPIVEDFVSLLDSANEVLSDDPDMIVGLDYLVSIGLLDAADKECIING